MKQLWASLFLLVSLGMAASGFAGDSEILSQYQLSQPGEAALKEVAHRFEIVKREGRQFDVIVPKSRAQELLRLVPDARLVWDDIKDEHRALLANESVRAGYRSYDEIKAYLEELVAQHPELVKLETIGQSSQGRDLFLLKVSDNVHQDEEGEPRLLLDAATHGDEWVTVEVLLRLVDELVKGYGQTERITAMLDGSALYVVPVVNPDGFVRRDRYADGRDPNRDYPWPRDPDHKSIGIIQIMRDLTESQMFAGSLDFHAYGGMVMYPWAYTQEQIEDQVVRDEFANLAASMAEENSYAHGPVATTIYLAPGSSADYYFWKFNTKALAVEVADDKIPPPSSLPRYVDDAREMTWRFIEHFTL